MTTQILSATEIQNRAVRVTVGRKPTADRRYPSGKAKPKPPGTCESCGMLLALHAHTTERCRQSPVARSEAQVVDASGNIGDPLRASDEIDRLLAERKITAAEFDAADDFRDDFRGACYDTIGAQDASRPVVSGCHGEMGFAQVAARKRVANALRRLTKPGHASVIWHVVGLEMPLRQWVTIQRWNGRRVSPENAEATLIAALRVLANQTLPNQPAIGKQMKNKSRGSMSFSDSPSCPVEDKRGMSVVNAGVTPGDKGGSQVKIESSAPANPYTLGRVAGKGK